MAAASLAQTSVLFATFLFLLTTYNQEAGAQFYGGPPRPFSPPGQQTPGRPGNGWNSGTPTGNARPNQPQTGNRPPSQPQTGSAPQPARPSGNSVNVRNPALLVTRNTVCPVMVMCYGLQRCYRDDENPGCPPSTTCCSVGFNSVQGVRPFYRGCCVPN